MQLRTTTSCLCTLQLFLFLNLEHFISRFFLQTISFLTMLFFLVSCLSFLLLSQSFLKSNPTPKIRSRMWRLPWIFREIIVLLANKRKNFIRFFEVPSIKKILSPQFEILEEVEVEKQLQVCLLDLPDLVLNCILEKLSPAELCRMAGVCSCMREKCRSDHLWQKLMKQKWGEVIGDAVYREWQSQFGALEFSKLCRKKKQILALFSTVFGYESEMKVKRRSFSPPNSVMACYLALESGKFWFPAQVFNRENGHVGFMLSCYDAQLSYGSTTDNFVARYKAQGRSMIEDGIDWERIRAPIVDTPANVLHISSCLDDLKPGDHVEIQWRKNNDFPYGWWYGVVGHLDSCSGNEFNCHCHSSDTVMLEFKQYSRGSRWRKAKIDRKSHRQVGNEVDGNQKTQQQSRNPKMEAALAQLHLRIVFAAIHFILCAPYTRLDDP